MEDRCPNKPRLLALLVAIASLPLSAITIDIANPYTVGTIDTANLSPVDTAGGRIPDPYPASPDDATGVLLTIGDAAGDWRVDIQQSDILWDPDVVIQVQRRNGGTGLGTAPQDGTTYFALDGSVQYFFSGNLDRNDIRIRFRLQMNEPATRLLPVDARSYSTDIIFTVTDT